MSVSTEERHSQWAVMLANGVIIDEEKPYATEAEALKALQRERQHLSAYGVGEVYWPVLVQREVVLTVSSWEHSNV